MKPLVIRTAILRSLHNTEGVLMPGESLQEELMLTVRPVPMVREINDALVFLENQNLIVGIRNGLDASEVKWRITDLGTSAYLNR